MSGGGEGARLSTVKASAVLEPPEIISCGLKVLTGEGKRCGSRRE